ncbi:MAG TPA: GntR family transcriptional regulator, partial [Aminivibrio sp.]|nr:GntR family transcriptional regulator [Aminivibrio sp.]
MILFELDENSGKPKSRQISDLLADRMKTGLLKPGDRLPSTRKLADMLRVHRSTVALAYQTLWSLGFVDLRRGSAPVVRSRAPLPKASEREPESALDWDRVSSSATAELYRRAPLRTVQRRPSPPGDWLSFEFLTMDP